MKSFYRPEIDGLRAIAVFAVIIYHSKFIFFNKTLLPGGFYGVDVFFVISGYLITTIIYKELLAKNKISFLLFYERRVRRIFPVLIFISLIFTIFSYFFIYPQQFIQFSKSAIYSLLSISNIFFYFNKKAYIDNSFDQPFLHTWSLSIEEQFYIIFPILFFFLYKFFKKNIIYIIFFIIIINLIVVDIFLSKSYPLFNFYLLSSRAWELLFGSLLACILIKKKYNFLHQQRYFFKNILSIIGLLLLFISFVFIDDKISNPSIYTLIPIIGISLLILFGGCERYIKKVGGGAGWKFRFKRSTLFKNNFVTIFLSNKYLVFFGLISYSLYLWHYPIFSFSEITNILNFESRFSKLFLIFVVFIFSIFSYFFIEKPFRNKFIVSTKVLTVVLSFLFFFIIIFNLYVVKNEGLLNRLSEVQIKFFKNNNFRNLKSLDGQLCFKTAKSFCEYNTNKSNTVFLLGDSHAAQIAEDLKISLNDRNFNFVVMANKCLRIPFFDYVRINDADETFCEKDYHKLVHDRLLYSSNSIIIITGRWSQYLNKGLGFSNNEGQKEIDNNNFVEFRSKDFDFKLFLDSISKNNKIILIYPIPEVGFDVKQKIFKDFTFLFKKNNNTQLFIYSTNYKVFEARNKISFSLLDSFENSNVFRVYPHKIFCNTLVNNRCIVNDKFNIFYDDNNHLSPIGSQLLTEKIIKVVDSLK